MFTPERSGNAVIRFSSTGISRPEILATEPAHTQISCVEGLRQTVEVKFVEPYGGPIELTSWEEAEDETL